METAPVAENAVGHIAHGNGGLRCVFCTISTMEMVVFFGGGGLVDKKKTTNLFTWHRIACYPDAGTRSCRR